MNSVGPMPHRARMALLLCSVSVLVVLAGIAVTLGQPILSYLVLGAGGFLVLSIALISQRFILPLMLLALFLPLPASFPTAGYLFGLTFYVTDALIVLALLAVKKRSSALTAGILPVLFLASLAIPVVVGLLKKSPVDQLLLDLRPPLYLVAAFLIGSASPSEGDQRTAMRVATFVLWYSVAGIVLSTLTGATLVGGAVHEIRPNLEGTGLGEVRRFQIQSTLLSLLILSACAAMIVVLPRLGRQTMRVIARLGVPALIIVFFGFSRHSLVALVVTVAVAFLVTPRRRRLLEVIPAIILVAGITATPILLSVSDDKENSEFLVNQLEGYELRVVQGFTLDAIGKDQGLELRQLENKYAWQAFMSYPVTGIGLGTKYRPLLPDYLENFFPEGVGPTFSHNVFLWYMAKTGVLGLGTLLVFLTVPLTKALRRMRTEVTAQAAIGGALAAAVIGFVSVNLVAPYLNALQGAALVGLILGFLSWRSADASTGESGDTRPGRRREGTVTIAKVNTA